jgi:RNA polymerase sigma factor (sigma-70 family)
MPGLKKVSPKKDDPEVLQDIKIWKSTGCQKAMLRLIKAHEGRIERMARKRAADADTRQDLVSVGYMALFKAASNYTPKPDVPFFAYAFRYIRKAMNAELHTINNIVVIPRHKLREARTGLMSEMEVELLNEARHTADIEDIYDTASATSSSNSETELIYSQDQQAIICQLEKAMECLSPGETLLIKRRLLGDNSGDASIDDLDMTDPRMRKMEKRAMMRLKTSLLKQGFTPQLLMSEL